MDGVVCILVLVVICLRMNLAFALEAAVEDVPTVCWPSLGDHQMNSRFVGAVWGTGLDMKDVCDRAVVQRREDVEGGDGVC